MDNYKLIKYFGEDEFGFALLPPKISNVTIARITDSWKVGYCTFCFPHGPDMSNNRWAKDLKCWKRYRNNQWR